MTLVNRSPAMSGGGAWRGFGRALTAVASVSSRISHRVSSVMAPSAFSAAAAPAQRSAPAWLGSLPAATARMGAGAARSAPEQLRSVSWLCGGVTAGGSWGRQGLSVAGAARGYETPKQARRWRDKPGLGSPGGQKMKTHKGAKKRFFVTHTGKVMCMPQGKQHLNYGTSGRKRQTLRKKVRVHPGQEKAIKMLLMLHRRPLNPKTPGKSKVRLMLKSAQPTA